MHRQHRHLNRSLQLPQTLARAPAGQSAPSADTQKRGKSGKGWAKVKGPAHADLTVYCRCNVRACRAVLPLALTEPHALRRVGWGIENKGKCLLAAWPTWS